MKLRRYSEQDLKAAVKSSNSMRQVLLRLNVAPYGGNYAVLKKAIKHSSLDISHFSGQGWSKGKSLPSRTQTKHYLRSGSSIQSFKLKNRLLKEGLFEAKCANCNLTEWMDQPLPLELDHINGNNRDNRLENLRLLCPNCHAQTDTYRGRNKSSRA